jgi:putative transposase
MPQPSIPLEPGQMYHIWTHANGDENLFREDENYTYFLEKYSYYIARCRYVCLLPDAEPFTLDGDGERGRRGVGVFENEGIEP